MLDSMWPVYGGVIEASFGARIERDEAVELSRLLGKVINPAEDT